MKNYKYLDLLGVEKENQYHNWFDTIDVGNQEEKWKEERMVYGIDSRSTWNFNSDTMDYLYIHLKMYNEVNIVELSYHHIEFDGKDYNVQQALDMLLSWFETVYYPSDRGDSLIDGDTPEHFEEMRFKYMCLFAKILPYLWW